MVEISKYKGLIGATCRSNGEREIMSTLVTDLQELHARLEKLEETSKKPNDTVTKPTKKKTPAKKEQAQ